MPDPAMWWGVGGVVGTWAVGAFAAWLRARGDHEAVAVKAVAPALDGYERLTDKLRSELDRVHVEVSSLRAAHLRCERDMQDLRGDLRTLRNTLVAQIDLESRKDGGSNY